MKNIFSLILALTSLSSFQLEASVLTPAEAIGRVCNPRLQKRLPASSSHRLVKTFSEHNLPTLYLFSLAEKAIAVSADSNAPALLAILDNPISDACELPEPVADWLTQYSVQIESIRNCNPCGLESFQPLEKESEAVGPLLLTRWGQRAPYNQSCPSLATGRAATGCVATAMAQVMKFHNWPEVGNSSNSYTDNGLTLSMNFYLYRPDWGNMLDQYNYPEYNATQATAVSDLMLAAGISLNMHYSVSGSGATISPYKPLYEYFDYSGSMRHMERKNYSASDWEAFIYNSLHEGSPVIYSALNVAGGSHCFICDGYDGDGYFHFNWGWNGHSDGWFLMTAADSETAIDGYTLSQTAVTGVRPAVEEETWNPVFRSTGFNKQRIADATDSRWWSDYHTPQLPCDIRFESAGLPTGASVGLRFTAADTTDFYFPGISSTYYCSSPVQYLSAPRPKELPDGVYTATIAAQAPDGSYYPIEFSDDALISLPVSKVDGEFFYNQVKGSQTSVGQLQSAPSTEWFDLSGASLGSDRPEAPGLYIRTDTAPDGSRCSTKVAVR